MMDLRMRKIRLGFRRLPSVILSVLVAAAIPVLLTSAGYSDPPKQPSSLTLAAAAPKEMVPPQAKGGFDQEWADLIAAAQREGKLVIASGGAPSRQYRPIIDVFQKKFGVSVEVTTGNATVTVNRVLAERKAGKYTVDVALISVRENNQRLVPSGSLIPLAPLLVRVATALGPILTKVVKALTPVLDVLGDALGDILVALLPLLPPLAELLQAFTPLIPPLAKLVTLLVRSLMPFLTPLIKLVGALAEVISRSLAKGVEVLTFLLSPLEAIFRAAGIRTGVIGTTGVRFGDERRSRPKSATAGSQERAMSRATVSTWLRSV